MADIEELKRIRKANIIAHKKKKNAYYLNKKEQIEAGTRKPKKIRPSIDYEAELFDGDFATKMKEIVKKQKSHIDSRHEVITQKISQYKKNKQTYYMENKEKRLEYDRMYRKAKREKLQEYKKEYYQKNKARILQLQKEARLSKAVKDVG